MRKLKYTWKSPIMLEVDGKYQKILPGDIITVKKDIKLTVEGKEVSWFDENGFEAVKPKPKAKPKPKPATEKETS